ncbi:hypothetical protein [Actinocrispum wychmicini]|uniref:Uncharacterized protein n=1 Tax=Actinocrispum wychmicini TaxID=1213861 RepID=A0A4R2JCF2_9PSEU|nr:hypothetical protein [Actinocrispum wychmicini]TCO56564.1 hypothetical protein EV192_10637 [Actinocrispum wychmicini]
MEWTPESIKAEIAYRTVDPVTLRQIQEARRTAQPRWWQRLLSHKSQHDVDDGNGERSAA